MGDVAADVAQLKRSNNECHASAFRYIQICEVNDLYQYAVVSLNFFAKIVIKKFKLYKI